MIFRGENNQSITMNVLGYQFPKIRKPRSYDANCLLVQLKVKHHFACWQKNNSALLTTELEELIVWLHDLANNSCKLDCLCFTESNIVFQYMGLRSNNMLVRIHLDLEFRNPDLNKEADYFFDFTLNKEELLCLCFDLEEELQYYPKR